MITKSRFIKNLIITMFLLILLPVMMSSAKEPKSTYSVIPLEGTVNPISAEFIVNSIKKANENKSLFIVLTVDTPGGLMTSMRDIIKEIFSSKVPVVVYTYPKGAQAASAGGFIMLAGHVNAMSPGTEIGAMHPVSPFLNFTQKGDDEKNIEKNIEKSIEKNVMGMKVLNDTIAYGKSIAQKRKRNEKWVIDAIDNAASATYSEAKNLNVVDIVAEDIPDLLKQLNNREIDLNGEKYIFTTEDLQADRFAMSGKERFLNFIADPQIVFFLFIIAVVGIGIEFKSPGLIFPSVIGGISFIMFLMAINILPINYFGLGLIALAIVMFVLELQIPSFGLLTIGGVVSFVVGSLILFDSPLKGFSISYATILSTVFFILLIVFVVLRSVVAVHRQKSAAGVESIVDETGVAKTPIASDGKVFVHGELWNAYSDAAIESGSRVKVISIEGMRMKVEKF